MDLGGAEEKERGIKYEKEREERRSGGECKREARSSRSLQSTSAFSRSDGGNRHSSCGRLHFVPSLGHVSFVSSLHLKT